jgi:hypothetical protein
MIVDKVLTWLAERWMKKNLTAENFTAWCKGLWAWLCDKETQSELGRLFKTYAPMIIEELKKQKKRNEETDSDSPDSPCC